MSGLVLLATLAGCAAGGPLAVPEPAAGEARAPVTETVRATDGEALALAHWPPVPGADPAGDATPVILAVHGYGDYGQSTFARAGQYWAARGFETYAYDQRGFGRNRSYGHWPGADALIRDLVGVADQLRARHPCRSLVVIGHSMGGGIVLAAAAEGLAAEGIVLAAPAIWGGRRLNLLHRLAAWTAAALVPERRFSGRGVVRIQASDNLEMLRALGRDPHYLSPPSARELMGLVRVTDRAAEAAPRVALPALLLLGEKDQIVRNGAVEAVFRQLTGPRRVIRYPEGWHLLFRDLQAERVWADVADWAVARGGTPAPGCSGTRGS